MGAFKQLLPRTGQMFVGFVVLGILAGLGALYFFGVQPARIAARRTQDL